MTPAPPHLPGGAPQRNTSALPTMGARPAATTRQPSTLRRLTALGWMAQQRSA